MSGLFKYYPVLNDHSAKQNLKEYRILLLNELCRHFDRLNTENLGNKDDNSLSLFLMAFNKELHRINHCTQPTNDTRILISSAIDNLRSHVNYETIKESLNRCLFAIDNESTIAKSRRINVAKNQRIDIQKNATLMAVIPGIASAAGVILYVASPLGLPSLIAAGITLVVLLMTQALYWHLKNAIYTELNQKINTGSFEPELSDGLAVPFEKLPQLKPVIQQNTIVSQSPPPVPPEAITDILNEISANTIKLFAEDTPIFVEQAGSQIWHGFNSLMQNIQDNLNHTPTIDRTSAKPRGRSEFR